MKKRKKAEAESIIGSLSKQSKPALAVAFACVVAFMGIGLVDPILQSIAKSLHATAAQTSLLFTSYMLVTGVVMLFTGFISSRIGAKKTLLIGLVVIILFSFLGGLSGSVGALIGFRAGWGLGNALFIATALSTIIGVSTGGSEKAVIMYEAAMGMGMSVGPLIGGILGSFSWRGPFFGVAFLMLVAFVLVWFLLDPIAKPKKKAGVWEALKALEHGGLKITGLTALCYNFGFFTVLAYSPFLLRHFNALEVGFSFFGWGILLAVSSVFLAPKFEKTYGTTKMLLFSLLGFAVVLGVMGIFTEYPVVIMFGIMISGFFQGISNTLLTTTVMEVAPVERSIASAAYSFVRFTGGAIAPYLAGKIAEWFSPHITFYFAGVIVAVGSAILYSGRSYLQKIYLK